MALALYRRYRPDTFEGVIGQDHVTKPLCRALDEGKLTHAYLFSGPRGCGKTSSARILARCINCVEGPTSHPCGKCESCRDLATNGPGSIDVVEIDAASHGSVDDARELRERAGFAPARDRYKIFILDEAHMVTSNGFNALLKIVEEPPEHVMFIFATTEPDKVIGTIRSRTHHYPFRLVPPEIMQPYLEEICARESIKPEQGVLKLAMRAGGGSMRDTLSVIDQLMVGATDGVIAYTDCVALLGFTPDDLISEAIDAVIQRDGPALYEVIEKVVIGGFDPRKFVEDLLAYIRDLLVLAIAGSNAVSALGSGQSAQMIEDMQRQASSLSLKQLNTMAERINSALSSMSGTVSPRMRLELLAASLLVPVQDGDIAARKDSLGQQIPHHQPVLRQNVQLSSQSDAGQLSGWAKAKAQMEAQAQSQAEQPVEDKQNNEQEQNLARVQSQSPASSPNLAAAQPAKSKEHSVSVDVSARGTQQQSEKSVQQQAIRTVPLDPDGAQQAWDQIIESLPQDIRSTVSQEHIPHVELGEYRGAPYIFLTFANPLSQHAFSLAVSSEPVGGKTSLQQILNAKLTDFYGTAVHVAPARLTADGQRVTPLRNMTTREQARVKAQIAQLAAKSALAGLTSASQLPTQTDPPSVPETLSADSDTETHTDDAEADKAAAHPSPYDPWADEVSFPVQPESESSHAEQTQFSQQSAAQSTQSVQDAQNAQNEEPSQVQVYDPWANQESDHTYGERDGASSSVNTAQAGQSGQISQFNQPRRTEHQAEQGTSIEHHSHAFAPHGKEESQPDQQSGSDDSSHHGDTEEDVYSLDDANLDEAQAMDMDSLSKLFNAKHIEDFAADDEHNPVSRS